MGFFNSLEFTIITFVAFTILVAVISYFKSKGVSEGDESGYYLAGRSLSGIVIAGSLIMTDLSAMQLVGNNGQSVVVGMGVFAAQGLGYSGMILAALYLIPRYLKCGITTMPEFYEMRYDKFTRNLITIIMMVNYIVVMLPSALYAGAQVFIKIFNFDELFGLSYFGAIVVLCIVIAIIGSLYAICGGLKAIAVSDTINGIGMMIGGVLVTFFGLIFLSNTLGGNDPMIIFDDADLDKTIEEMLVGRLENNGQVCNACKRFIVQKGIYDELAERLVEALKQVKRGDCLEEGAEITSLVTEKAAKTVEEQIQKTVEQGAELIYGGTRNGATVEPAVLVGVTPDMDIAKDMEVFGPAFPLIPFELEDEAIEIANQSTYGLCGGVMTADLNRAFRVADALEVGGAVVNGSGNYRQVEQPYGGVKQSGLGREGISILLEEYSNIKTIAVKNAF